MEVVVGKKDAGELEASVHGWVVHVEVETSNNEETRWDGDKNYEVK